MIRLKVSDVMVKDVVTIKKEDSILEATKVMRDKDIGFLIIAENNEALGIITDRDIVVALSKEISINTNITKVMKKYVITANEKDELATATDTMGYMQIRRLVIIDDDKKIKGVLSLSDLLRYPLIEDLALETMIEISYNYPTQNDKTDITFQTSAFIF